MKTLNMPEILLPKDGTDMTKWAVNACDQFTSDYAYWQEVEKLVEGYPSTYNLIFPEIYLKDNPGARIKKINSQMKEYLDGGVFKSVTGGFILVERTTESGTRTGIVLAVDLEDYSFIKGDNAVIRSTEATVPERIPPRVEIRKDAYVELPHAMLLFNDEKNIVLNSVKRGKVLYDFDLQMNGGHIKGTFIENSKEVAENLLSLKDGSGMLFAVGDGNHSLATAKTCWDNLKAGLSEKERETHPARFALCEIVNIFDPALNFEPIHRLVKCNNVQKFIEGYKTFGSNKAYIVVDGKKREIPFSDNIPEGIRALDDSISKFIKENGGEVDYIHGEAELTNFTQDKGCVGILLPAIAKNDFFNLIISGGNLPRKTFSMGEGNEKRYYIEAKKIRN